MSDTDQAALSNPFQEVCIFLSQKGNDLAIAELIKRFGFSVFAFVSLDRMIAHLEKHPLTAAAFIQGPFDEPSVKVREKYHGPLYQLSGQRETMLETLGTQLREVHRNQMKIQDPKVLRILKTFDAFSRGAQKTLLLMGESSALELSLDYLRLFIDDNLIEIGDELPESIPAEGGVCFVSRNLFDHPVEWQQRWNIIFGDARSRHIILEEKSVDGLDELYLAGKLDEMLYERLSFRQTIVEPLKEFTFEELAVQPLQKNEPRLILDHEEEADQKPVVIGGRSSRGGSNTSEGSSSGRSRGLTRFISGFLKK